VIHLWSLDAPDNDRATDPAARDLGLGSMFAALSAIASQGAPARLFIITRGAVDARRSDPPAKGAAAALWGAGRTLAVEHAEAWGKLIDLDPSADLPSETESENESESGNETEIKRLAEEIQSAGDEDQIALRGRDRLVPRLVRAAVGGLGRPLVWRKDARTRDRGLVDHLEVARSQSLSPAAPRWDVRCAAAVLDVAVTACTESRRDRIARCVRSKHSAPVQVMAVDAGDEARSRALALHEQEAGRRSA
jgi:hypothetical protein